MPMQHSGLVSVPVMGAKISELAKRSMNFGPHLAGLRSGLGQNQLPSASSSVWHSRITELRLIYVHGLGPRMEILRLLSRTDRASVNHSICMPYGEAI